MNPSASLGRDEAANPMLDDLIAAITDKLQAGEAVDVEAYAAEHPDLASELRRLLPALQLMAAVGSSPGSEPSCGAEHGELSLHGALGDFRIVREVGRGGMGVVYEAEQISLRRRVALKVLPFAATMNPRHLQRFHNEAQAAACLHHTNIVPVFYVGSERGVHFYAMQFIDGQPLSDVIHQLQEAKKKTPAAAGEVQTAAHQPSLGDATPPPAADMTPLTGAGRRGRDYFRKVAELGAQAAEALDHAHQLGIVHRDIKPANLLLDARGNLWVTDFGLAHIQHNEANLTTTGQAVGTPRYMSPEQALAQRVPVDHRTDVYSLGATLYELLTLRPAFGSTDRQELLRQIAWEEPSRPRRLERAIPAELEVIVLKAMEKWPQDRYATAQELADDLRCFLKHEPIRARPPSLGHRAMKWARRHRAVVRSAVAALAVTVIVLAISTGIVWTEVRAKDDALRQKGDALTLAEQRGAEARNSAEKENSQRQRAEALLLRAIKLAKGKKEAGALHQAVGLWEEMIAQHPDQPDHQRELFVCCQELADLLAPSNPAAAAQAHQRAIDVLRTMHTTFPNYQIASILMEWTLPTLYRSLGDDLRAARKFPEAEAAYRQARDDDRRFWKKERQGFREYVYVCNRLGEVLVERGKFQEAETVYREAHALLASDDLLRAEYAWGFWSEPMLTYRSLADLLWSLDRKQEASAPYREAQEYVEKVRRAYVRGPRPMPQPYHVLAWLLLMCPDPKLRDATRAADLAREGMSLAQRAFNKEDYESCSRAFAVAQYRAGNPKACCDILKHNPPGELLFVSAMAHQQLGESKQALQEFNRAVGWMDKNRPRDVEVRCLRFEAAELLGIGKQLQGDNKASPHNKTK